MLADPAGREPGDGALRLNTVIGIDEVSAAGLTSKCYLQRVAEVCAYVTHEGAIKHKISWFYPEIPVIYLVATPLAGELLTGISGNIKVLYG